jgi:cyclic beta-1,2-glucan synthetase
VLLSNGHYHVRVNEVGSGCSELNRTAITRFAGDKTSDEDGFYIYVRDYEDGCVWSAGYQPTRAIPSRYAVRYGANDVEITRADHDIECRLTVAVDPQHNFEVRTCRLKNLGRRARRLELTSYLEWVLGSQDGDRNHPAFSKLFVETEFSKTYTAVIARRRPRSNDETELFGFHALAGDATADSEPPIQYETNRWRFIGRGRTLRRPLAVMPNTELTGDSGPVLDPIASLRVAVELRPGDSREIRYVLGAAADRKGVDEALEAFRSAPSAIRPSDIPAEEIGNGSPAPAITAAGFELDAKEIYKPATSIETGDETGTVAPARSSSTELQFDNGYGGFSGDGREYIIRVSPSAAGQRRPPMPWVNVIANEQAGFLVTESGAGYTWSGNSRTNRLTAWHNDPVCDPHGEALWVRDEDRKLFWSPTPGPTPSRSEYEVSHGFGYTTFRHTSHELSQQVTVFMARDESVKLTRVHIVNQSRRKRRLSLFSYVHWALGGLASETAGAIATSCDNDLPVIWATNPGRELYGGYRAFSAITPDEPDKSQTFFTCDRANFLGQYGDTESPRALASSETLDGNVENKGDACAAWQTRFELEPGEAFDCTLILGETSDDSSAKRIVRKYTDPLCTQQALADVRQYWLCLLSSVKIETPNREIDLMVNGWLTYQNLSCRMWGRSAYYQPGGAFGFRDQLQDSAALIYYCPELTRTQILRHASQQFVEGDVLHWWHPDNGYGLRTRFSDDLLWLPCVTAEYVARTGDLAILDERAPFVVAPTLGPGQQEAYLRPEAAGESASVYEHCCRALDRGLTIGERGLPLIGCGDWNDGFSRVGRQGRGESVWTAFFISYVLQHMLPICISRGDKARIARYNEYRIRMTEAANTSGWDGAWYRRAYYDNGQPIGSAQSDECQLDALVQAWAVISGVATPERAEMGIRAVEERLVCKDAGLIRLLTPPFNRTPNDPGYIKGYLPGIRENGGQYTHGILWYVRAIAEMGWGTRAVELLRMLSPVSHAASAASVQVYQAEPYVVAADVYGEPPHVGRGGWTWYTGSAGWMFRVAIESIFGVTTEGGHTLVVNPSIASHWPRCRMTYRLSDGQTSYEISIQNPDGSEHGVREAQLDGRPLIVNDGAARVPLASDGVAHRVEIRL